MEYIYLPTCSQFRKPPKISPHRLSTQLCHSWQETSARENQRLEMRNSRLRGMGGDKGEGIWNAGRMYWTIFFSLVSASSHILENLTHQNRQFTRSSISLVPSILEPNSPTADSRVQIHLAGKGQGKGEKESGGRVPNGEDRRKGWIQLKQRPRALVTWWNLPRLVLIIEIFLIHVSSRASWANGLLIQSEKKLTDSIQESMGKTNGANGRLYKMIHLIRLRCWTQWLSVREWVPSA